MAIEEIIKKFSEVFEGEMIFPENDRYDKARKLWNGLYNKYPAAIARCGKPSDVVAAVNFVRENDLTFSVRGGGHDYAGNSVCDDGLVIDLSSMNKVEVDPNIKKAIVQGGATVGEFDAAAQKHGLATTTGTVSTIGIGGLALGGGSGYLSRRFGMTLDNVVSVEIVTADGRHILASAEENSDLFWAVRGGGGNFGIVTSFKFRLHKVGRKVLSFQAYFPYEQSREVLEFYRDFMAKASDELQCYAFFLNVPAVEPFPKEYHGKTTCAFIACHTGDPEKGKEELQPLHNFGDPFLKFIQPMEYTALQKSFDAGVPKGLRWFTKAHYLSEISDTAIDILEEYTQQLPGAFTMTYLEPMGGMVKRIKSSATAFPHRDKAYSLHILPGWGEAEKDKENIDWAEEFHRTLQKETVGGVYVNLMSHDEEERVTAAYVQNYDRLVEIKKKWDPDNLFRSNHNIDPG
ncbi:FAD-binding oxidoreductase [Salinimicrobium terrae]|uniref:FAD-binding oxidoreductase n=1 Tax=Salinimicrobium terrae TaxID=470866 RepID=UPI000427F456|nr:FAD-binding oxidoreductase [Salinimicrobium terrae]